MGTSIQNRRNWSVDVLRGVAMIMVILCHYEQLFHICKWFQLLRLGCPIFFVCSGYAITGAINRRFYDTQHDSFAYKDFFLSRFKALAPGWYLAIFIIFLVNTFVIAVTGDTLNFGTNREPLSILLNLAFLNGFLPFCNNNVLPGGWYVGTTAILYCLSPFMLKAVNKNKKRHTFFILSSAIGIAIWMVLFYSCKEEFGYNGFSYFFFLAHYPEYMLGMLLYYDIKEGLLNERKIKLCLPAGFVSLIATVAVYKSDFTHWDVASAWLMGLTIYFFLYNMISTEDRRNESIAVKVLASYGKLSYAIYLIEAFFAFTFVIYTEKIANSYGLSIMNAPCFILLIPVVLTLCYIAGYMFNKLIKKATQLIFR